MGLAIYNSIMLDVRFPKIVYKKLLGSCPGLTYTDRHKYEYTLEDLKQVINCTTAKYSVGFSRRRKKFAKLIGL